MGPKVPRFRGSISIGAANSERNPRAELQLSRLIRHRRENTKTRRIDIRPGRREMNGIIDIESIRLERQLHPLHNLKLAADADIHVGGMRREEIERGRASDIACRVSRRV